MHCRPRPQPVLPYVSYACALWAVMLYPAHRDHNLRYHTNQKHMRCMICILGSALYIHIKHQVPHAYKCEHACIEQTAHFHCARAQSFSASVCEVSVRVCASARDSGARATEVSNMHELARIETVLSQRSFAHSETLLSQRSCEYACSGALSALAAKSGEYSTLRPHSQVFLFPPKQVLASLRRAGVLVTKLGGHCREFGVKPFSNGALTCPLGEVRAPIKTEVSAHTSELYEAGPSKLVRHCQSLSDRVRVSTH